MKCKRAYIIFVADNKQNRINKFNIENILNELSMLCDTANYKVIERYSFIQQKIDSLTQQLDAAIEKEDYEEAENIQNQIDKLSTNLSH